MYQGFYAIFAYLDPIAFADVRDTTLAVAFDIDWVQIYASRTLFIALVIGSLLYFENYKLLLITALMGIVMPLTDAHPAYTADAAIGIIAKHIATIIYLCITSLVLAKILKQNKNMGQQKPE